MYRVDLSACTNAEIIDLLREVIEMEVGVKVIDEDQAAAIREHQPLLAQYLVSAE